MSKSISRGRATCTYQAKSLQGFDLMPSIYQQQIAYDGYDGEKDTFISASKFSSPPMSIAMGILARQQNVLPPINRDMTHPVIVGTAIHSHFEQVAVEGYEYIAREVRLNYNLNGKKISGKFDLLFKKNGAKQCFIADYKSSSAWAASYDSPQHTIQLSINRFLVKFGEPSDPAKAIPQEIRDSMSDIGLIFECYRDWNIDDFLAETERHGQSKYPTSPWCAFQIKLMDFKETMLFMEETIKEVEDILSGKIKGSCPRADLWKQSPVYGYKRCAFYCDGKMVCPQYKACNGGIGGQQ